MSADPHAPVPLQLHVPRLLDARSPVLDLREKSVRQWVSELPVLNLPRSVKALLDLLGAFAREPLPAAERLPLLDVYREPVENIFQFYDNQRVRQFPLSTGQRQQLKEDCGRLHLELAHGYKAALLDLLASGAAPRKDPLVLLATTRAVEQLAHALLHVFRIYSSTPAHLYADLHRLWGFAAEQGWHRTPPASAAKAAAAMTVDHLYKRTLLVACADPFRLADGDATRLWRMLEPYAQRAELGAHQGDAALPDGSFLVPVEADAAPHPGARPESVSGPTLHLNTLPVSQAVRQDVAKAQATGQAAALEELRALDELLAATRQGVQVRRAPRVPAQRAVHVAVGLASVHAVYRGEGARLLGDRDTEQYGISVSLDTEGGEVARVEDWSVANESATGLLLACAGNRCGDLQVGDLLGICEAGALVAERLKLAVVRWQRRNPEGALEAGVELIAGRAAPVGCGPGEEDATHPALYFPAQDEARLPATLLTATTRYSLQQPLFVTVNGQLQKVLCGPALQSAPHWTRFGFNTIRK